MVRRVRFRVPLSEADRVDVEWEKEGGRVMAFVVNYVAEVGGKSYSVVRFDTAHGFPHKDVCYPDGTVGQKERLPEGDLHLLADSAIDDIKSHWQTYRARFEKWLK